MSLFFGPTPTFVPPAANHLKTAIFWWLISSVFFDGITINFMSKNKDFQLNLT
jgi:hypothetical protein